mgnify:CR=1 FL=1
MTRTEHPSGLYFLFTVEMWERFSFYGMRALLMLYMIKSLGFQTEKAGTVYGYYTGLVYMTPLIGGYLADRYFGARFCIMIGGILMALGHFAMAFPGESIFYLALGLLIIGNGFFKPNISTMVGALYEENDARRDGGFTIFYMGINLGAFFSPLVCGTLGEKYGWHYGFAAAGVGMVIGLLTFLWGQKRYLGEHGLQPCRPKNSDASQPTVSLTREEWHKLYVIFFLVGFSIFFWASFEQAGSSLTLFADRSTDRMISFLKWEFPTSYFQSVNPFLIFILAPLFSSLWIRLSLSNRNPSAPLKFAGALFLVGLGFLLMIGAAKSFQAFGKVSIWWLMGVYFLHTIGELCLSPVGLSLVTKLAPAQFASLMMGTWFLSSFAANYVGGIFAGNYDAMLPTTFFAIPLATAWGAALLLFLLTPKLKSWMHGVE